MPLRHHGRSRRGDVVHRRGGQQDRPHYALRGLRQFGLPGPDSGPAGIAAGPDGALWFVEDQANQVGRITTAGVLTEYPVPTPSSFPYAIAPGPDGAGWFTEYQANKIGRITMAGVITEYDMPTFGYRTGSRQGPMERCGSRSRLDGINRITMAGVVTEFAVPTPGSARTASWPVPTGRCGSRRSSAATSGASRSPER